MLINTFASLFLKNKITFLFFLHVNAIYLMSCSTTTKKFPKHIELCNWTMQITGPMPYRTAAYSSIGHQALISQVLKRWLWYWIHLPVLMPVFKLQWMMGQIWSNQDGDRYSEKSQHYHDYQSLVSLEDSQCLSYNWHCQHWSATEKEKKQNRIKVQL